MSAESRSPLAGSPARQQLVEELNQAAAKASNAAIEVATRTLNIAQQDQLRAAVGTRLARAAAQASMQMDADTLASAASASSDFAALLEVITRPETMRDLQDDTALHDPLRPAKLAGVQARQRLLELSRGAYSASQLAALLGISRQAVDNRRKHGKLLAVRLGRRGNYYPAIQLQDGRVLDGLDIVLAELHEYDAWTQLSFLLNPNTWLDDETPIEVLWSGRIEDVRDAASVYGEHVAA